MTDTGLEAATTGPFSRDERMVLAAALVNALGSGAYAALSTLYFIEFVGIEVRTIALGLAIGAAIALVLTYPVGALADRVQAVRALSVAYVMRAVGYVSLAFVHSPASFLAVVIPTLVVDRIASPLTMGAISAVASDGGTPRLLGWRYTIATVGLGIGGLVASASILAGESAARAVIVGNGLTYVIGALLLVTLDEFRTSSVSGSVSTSNSGKVAQLRAPLLVVAVALAMSGLQVTDSLANLAAPAVVANGPALPLAATVCVTLFLLSGAFFAVPVSKWFERSNNSAPLFVASGILGSLGAALLIPLESASRAGSVLIGGASGLALGASFSVQSIVGWATVDAISPTDRKNRNFALMSLGPSLQRLIGPGVVAWLLLPGLPGSAFTAGLALAALALLPASIARRIRL